MYTVQMVALANSAYNGLPHLAAIINHKSTDLGGKITAGSLGCAILHVTPLFLEYQVYR